MTQNFGRLVSFCDVLDRAKLRVPKPDQYLYLNNFRINCFGHSQVVVNCQTIMQSTTGTLKITFANVTSQQKSKNSNVTMQYTHPVVETCLLQYLLSVFIAARRKYNFYFKNDISQPRRTFCPYVGACSMFHDMKQAMEAMAKTVECVQPRE